MRSEEYRLMHDLELRHWWFRGRRLLLSKLLSRYAAPDGRWDLLDYGSGTGGNTAVMRAHGRVVGLEPDSLAVALAVRRGGALICRGVGTELPFSAESFDAVLAADVLEHIADDARAATEIFRVLRRRGILVFSVPAHPWLFSSHDLALGHYRRYTRRTIRSTLEHAGFRVRWISYWNFTLFPFVAVARAIDRIGRESAVRSDARETPALLNQGLLGLLALEAWVLPAVRLPWGVSLVGVAQRS